MRDHPRACWADASGMARHGQDAGVAQALLHAAREAGFRAARVGIAGTCIVAAVATRERGSAWRVVPPGRDAEFLRRRSLALLPIAEELQSSFGWLGLRTCGELAELPAGDIELRFGADGLHAWRLARAEDPRWPFRPPPSERASAEVEFDGPVEGTEPLRFVLPGLVEAVVAQMAHRQRIPGALRLILPLEGGGELREIIRPARPTAEPATLLRLAQGVLERVGPIPAPIRGARLEGVEEGAARADQLDAFRVAAPDPAALQSALLPVLGRWGEDAIRRAEHQGAHLPAAHALWRPAPLPDIAAAREITPSGSTGIIPLHGRADLTLCLRRLDPPYPIEVREGADHRPVALRLSGLTLPSGAGWSMPAGSSTVRVRAEGPERLSTGWWEGGTAREYWRVETPSGLLALLYRDARSGRWYLEGWYD